MYKGELGLHCSWQKSCCSLSCSCACCCKLKQNVLSLQSHCFPLFPRSLKSQFLQVWNTPPHLLLTKDVDCSGSSSLLYCSCCVVDFVKWRMICLSLYFNQLIFLRRMGLSHTLKMMVFMYFSNRATICLVRVQHTNLIKILVRVTETV